MESVTSTGPYVALVEAFSPENSSSRITLGLSKDAYKQQTRLCLRSMRGQFYGIVLPGMVMARHCFLGVDRPLMHLNDMNADQKIAVYTWKPADNYEWTGGTATGTIIRLPPPPDHVFVVLVRGQQPDGLGVSGVILRWNWIRGEDPNLSEAPIEWKTRYREKLWSREAQ